MYIDFTGFVGTELKYSTKGKRWEILSSYTKDILAFTNGTSEPPLGIRQWYFIKSECTDEGRKYRTLNFHQYVDEPGNYCCNDGTCISSENVCDVARHCDSGEDEIGCQLIKMPNDYDKNIAPLNVSIDFNILDIQGIHDNDDSFDVYFSINITWYDKKLMFRYLNNNEDVNTVSIEEQKEMWIPKVNFAYVRKSFDKYEEKIYIIKKSSPKMDEDLKDLHNVSEIYHGKDNPIVFFKEYYLKVFCGFDGIGEYPFESENCSIRFYLEGRANKLTKMISTLKHPSQTLVDEYEIKGWTKKDLQMNSKNMIEISLSLSKRPLTILMVTYLPTLLVNILNQATNYITGATKYDVIITVNITCMIVLASIYISVSASLPSTAGIKPIETWLLFNLSYPFLVIITNVIMQVSFILRLILSIEYEYE